MSKDSQAISKRIKIFECLKNYITSDGFIFLQETHSSVKDEKIWNDEFEGQLFLSHGKINSCAVAIGFVGTKALKILNIKRDNLGLILVIKVKIDDSVFVLINIYNAKNESEQLHTLNDLINPSLDSEGGWPVIKKRTLAKLIQITENLDLVIFGEFGTLKEDDLLLDNTILLVLFKDD